MNRRERRAAARKSHTPAELYEAGLRHIEAGRHLDAQLCCEQALAMDSAHADSLHLMGLLSLGTGQIDHAVEWIVRALRQNPAPEYLSSLGTALLRQGRQEEAVKAFDKAVQLRPDDADLWMKLGNVLIDVNRPIDALLSFQHVLKLEPRQWDASYRSGFLLHQLGRSQEALPYLDVAYELHPGEAAISQARADVLHRLNRFEEALAENRRAYALNPESADTCNNIGAALQSLGRDDAALEWFDRALKLRENYVAAMINKASLLQQLHRFDEAVAVYYHVKAIDPGNAEPDLLLALLDLLCGNFEAGWAGREARWRLPSSYPKFPVPTWLGSGSLEGKTILVGADEGLGDAIQFARYVPMLAERGARVILVVHDPLHLLMSDLPGVSQCIPISATASSALPAFDVHCPIMSLPLAFATRLDSIPPPTPHWPCPAAARVKAWQDRLDRLRGQDRLRVGLVWSGNPAHKNDHNRSLRLHELSRLLELDATFVSLQKDPRPADQATLHERTDMIDLTADLTDLSETAALLSCLDLVITVDTSVAHLAAALGRPTWILLPRLPDYRWLLERDDSPWYPTVRLFRQTGTREFASVLDRVRSELLNRIAAHSPQSRKSAT